MRNSNGRIRTHLHLTRIALAMLIGLLVTPLATPLFAAAQTDGRNAPSLDGRIGGTLEAFEAKYGEATNDPSSDVDAERAYANKNYREMVALAFDDHIYGVAFSSDLATTPDEERTTWTVSKATSLAKRFLPDDAACGDPDALPDGELRVQCTSEALAGTWGMDDYDAVSRAGAVGTLSFTLTLDPDDAERVTAIAAAVGTMSLEEAGPLLEYLIRVQLTNDFVPDILAFLASAINGEAVTEMSLALTVTIWNELYGSFLELAPPAAYANLHQQFLAVLDEIQLAQSNIVLALTFGDAAAGQIGVAHYGVARVLYDAFEPVLDQALADAGLL